MQYSNFPFIILLLIVLKIAAAIDCSRATLSVLADVPSFAACSTLSAIEISFNDTSNVPVTLQDFALPNLASVERHVLITGNPAFGSIDMDKLSTVGGDFSISNLVSLHSLKLSSLRRVDGAFSAERLPALRSLSFVDFSEAGTWILDSTAVENVRGFGMDNLDSLRVVSNDRLSSFQMDKLERIGVGGLHVSLNRDLAFKADMLQTCSGDIILTQISSISFQELKGVSGRFELIR